METRRFLLAISLSLIIFILYMKFFAPTPPETQPANDATNMAETQKKVAEKRENTIPEPLKSSNPASVKIEKAVAGKDIVIETDLIKAVVNTAGGVITKWELKQYREANKSEVGIGVIYKKITGQMPKEEKPKRELGNVELVPVYEGVDRKDMSYPLAMVPLEKDLNKLSGVNYETSSGSLLLSKDKPKETLTLVYNGPGGIIIEKKLTFHNDTYVVDMDIRTSGFDGYTISLGTDFGLADKVSSDASGRVGVADVLDKKFRNEKIGDLKGEEQQAGSVGWIAQEDKYFTAVLISNGNGIISRKKTVEPKAIGDLLTTDLTVKEQASARTFKLFAGPKSYTLLEAQGQGLEQMVDYGWFGILAKPMFWLLTKFYIFTKNYGVAIILLTIVVRVLLFYPSLKSATAMEEMKKIQPQLMAIREKFKKDPQRMNQEMMKLYKEHKVNPLGGCLPMLLQLPFFVALYNVLSVSIELRQSPFLSFWIKDLSVYDPYYILPVLMGVSMIFTMKMTSTTADPQQAKIMMFMNIAFIFLFAWLPAGLLLYITLSNVLSIVQQLYVRRLIGAAETPAV
ncbi:MAG TPA: membrane protein insertase YidC [Nitrospirota bacterium]|nr:membrane protein insertase YidC [Nitrospirota bacterium]